MSRHAARNALDQLVGRPALVAPRYAMDMGSSEVASSAMFADLKELASADPVVEAAAWEERKKALASAYGYHEVDGAPNEKPYAFANGKAIIPVHGILINRMNWCWSFCTGYNFIRSLVSAAEADPDVDGIIYDVNSYGGMVAGCRETADAIYKAKKPSIAVVDANCYSAAYMLASQTGQIVVTPTGGAGSIGVVLMHLDVSKALEDAGLKVTFVYAGSHKVDGNPYEPLSAEVEADFQTEIDSCYDMFVATVVRGRDMTDAEVRDTEARMYRADDALAVGLIDAVQNPDDAVEAFFLDASDAGAEDDDPPEPEENSEMPPANRTAPVTEVADPAIAAAAAEQTRLDQEAASAQAATAAAATARTAERTRISSIQGHAEAAGREALASHLALNTDLSAEVASGILAASPKAAVAPAPTAPQGSAFERAMDRSKQPNVGADAGASEEDEDGLSPAKQILRAQSRQTGFKPPVRH